MSFTPIYNLESLTEQQRQDYIKAVCNHLGIPSELNLVMVAYLDEDEGPRRLVAYIKRGAAEIIRDKRGIHVIDLQSKEINGSLVFTATGKDSSGRQEISTGAKWIRDLSGKALDDAIMTSQTRAIRRMTLQFLGAGVLDESEVQKQDQVVAKNDTVIGVPAIPTVAPASNAGTDVTSKPEPPAWMAEGVSQEEQQRLFEEGQAKLRAEAIASLNAKTAPVEIPVAVPEKKTRKPRAKKVGLDIGAAPVSEPVEAAKTSAPEPPQAPVTPTPAPVPAPPTPATPAANPSSLAARLTPEQVKPFRQRQFQFVTELEQHGFAPKEGIGNLDKMRSFVGLLFPSVTNFNELSIVQWEQYLNTVEAKLKKEGPAATIKYIEDAIGV